MSTTPHLAVDDVRTVAQLAGLAPSVHNTQPWRFTWDGQRFDVLEDRTRALPVLDRSGRERAVSIGAAGLHARLGFAGLGWDTTTTLLPDGDDGEVHVRLQVNGPRASTPEELELVAAIPRRGTDRDPYDERPLPDDVLVAVESAAGAEGGWTHVVSAEDLVELEVLLAHADAAQRKDPAYLEELAAWRRDDGAGVSTRSLPTVDPSTRGSSLSLRDFDAAAGTSAPAQPAQTPTAEHPTVLVVGTQHDTRSDWILSGFVLGRVLLQATVEGVAAQPVSSVLEVPMLRGRLRNTLRLVGYPQMVLRMGYGTAGPVSHRLPVDELLTVQT
jgi:nitroreductase